MLIEKGTTFGPYEIVAPIGSGGMGQVYRATDKRLERTVAIKVVSDKHRPNPDARERFEREANPGGTSPRPSTNL